MSYLKINSYTFPPDSDPSVSSFFSTKDLGNWNWENFSTFHLEENSGSNEKTIFRNYDENLNKILKNQSVPHEVKTKSEILIQEAKAAVKGKRKENTKSTICNVNINTNKGSIFGDVINDNQTENDSKLLESSNKKQKTDHVSNISRTWTISCQEDVYDAVIQHLDEVEFPAKFSLEKYHVIECGFSIKCSPTIPTDLAAFFDEQKYTITTPFKTYQQYTTNVLNIMKCNSLESAETVIKSEAITEKDIHKSFVKNFFVVCLWIYKSPDLHSKLSASESAFNFRFVWPIMDFVGDSISGMKFIPGEHILQCSLEEYKADGCILYDDQELSILETSGKFLLNDNSKYGRDHVKLHFGALQILNSICQKYLYATEATAISMRIPFLHVRHDTMYLWSIELCSPSFYCSREVFRSKVPKDMSSAMDILSLGNLTWCYKCILKDLIEKIKVMKEQHQDYKVAKVLLDDTEERKSLSSMIHLNIKKPVKGPGYHILLPEDKEEEDVSITYSVA